MNIQIPNLPAAIALNGTEQLEAVQAGTSVRVTTGQIANLSTGGAGGGNAYVADTVAAFEAASFPSDAEGVNILGYYSIGVGALQVRRVASEPTHPWKFRSTDRYLPDGSTDSANGGWWEGYSTLGDDVEIDAFGAVADNETDCLPAINNAMAYLLSLPENDVYECYRGTIRFTTGKYYFSDSITPRHPFAFIGPTAVGPHGESVIGDCWLTFPRFKSAFVLGPVVGINELTWGTHLENLYIVGGAQPGDGGVHGVDSKSRLMIRNCWVGLFGGDGVHISADSGIGGNGSGFLLDGVSLILNKGWGFYIEGNNGNAGLCNRVSCASNGLGGFYDHSFLGNTYLACQAAYHAGNPGYKADVVNAANVFTGCYIEDTDTASIISPSIVVGGFLSNRNGISGYPSMGNAPIISGYGSSHVGATAEDGSIQVFMGQNQITSGVAQIKRPAADPNINLNLKTTTNLTCWRVNDLSYGDFFHLFGLESTVANGLSRNVANIYGAAGLGFPFGFMLGWDLNGEQNFQRFFNKFVKPGTPGANDQVNDVCFNCTAAWGAPLAWQIVSLGGTKTWVPTAPAGDEMPVLGPRTVAQLTAMTYVTEGTRAFVTDATLAYTGANIGAALVGGSTNRTPVIYISGAWVIG